MFQEYTLGKEERQKLTGALAKNLKSYRCACGWSQENLADIIGVTRQTILSVENGKREMTWTMFLAFLLLFLSNEKTRSELKNSGVLTAQLAEFLGLDEKIF